MMRPATICLQLMLTLISGTLPGVCSMATGQESQSRPETNVEPGIERGRFRLNGEEPGQIWDREILSQPFDKQPFRQIAVPEWVQETLGSGYTLSVMNSEQRAEAAAHGVTLSEMGFVDVLAEILVKFPDVESCSNPTGKDCR